MNDRHSIHDAATAAVTPPVGTGPTLPPDLTDLGRALYAELRKRWLDGGRRPFLAAHRELAKCLGCSAGAIPHHMEALEGSKVIERTPYKNRRRILLLDRPGLWDQPGLWDSISDRSLIGATDQETAPSSAETAIPQQDAESDLIDQILPKGTHVLKQQQQDVHAWEGREGDHAALRAELKGDDADVVNQLFTHHPGLTLTQFAAEVAAAATRPNVFCPRAVALKALSSGERVTPARDVPAPAGEAPRTAQRTQRRHPYAADQPDALKAAWRDWEAQQRARDAAFAERARAAPESPGDAEQWLAEQLARGVPEHVARETLRRREVRYVGA